MLLGQLFIISAPSGAGKTSVVKRLIKGLGNLRVSISHTTRAKRPGELEGEDYFFVTVEQFKALLSNDGFIEHAQVFDNFYGTSKSYLEHLLSQGLDVILEIDWQGAQQVRKLLPDSAWLFILPPSLDALKARLYARGQDEEDTIDIRMRAARDEMSHWDEADYLIINDQFDAALEALQALVRSLRLRTGQQQSALQDLIEDLLT